MTSYAWLRYGVDTLVALLAICKSNAELCLFAVSMNKLLTKLLRDRLNETPQRPSDVTEMWLLDHPVSPLIIYA